MKVKCVTLKSSGGVPQQASSWLRIGCVYHVLAIEFSPARTMFRLVGEEVIPALFQPDLFEIVSSIIPSNWAVVSRKPGFIELSPKAWTRPGFWVDFFDGEPNAVACFENERRVSISADP